MCIPVVSSGKGDGDEHHEPHQRPAGGHDRGPASAGGPEEEGDAAEGPAGRHPDVGPGQTHQHQPGAAAPVYPGEDLSPRKPHGLGADTEATTTAALTGRQTSDQNLVVLPQLDFVSGCIILFYCKYVIEAVDTDLHTRQGRHNCFVFFLLLFNLHWKREMF